MGRRAGRREYAKGNLKRRRHWQREQVEKDQRIKESVWREKYVAAVAARSRRLGVDATLTRRQIEIPIWP